MWYNWLIVILPFFFVLYMAFHTRKYIRGIPDFLAGGRLCGRYLLSVGGMENGLSVMFLIAYIETHYRTGFSIGFWSSLATPIGLILALTGFVTYRLRETKAMSMGQFLEMRYSRSFRLFCAFLRTSVELLCNAILPAISARFFIYLLGIPHYIDIFGFKIQSLALVIAVVLILASVILLAGEDERVALGVDALERGDVAAFGKLLFQSHESSRTLFENSCPELDTLVEIAKSLPGCAGARLSGGGFGGISIHLVQSDMTAEYGRRLAEAYRLQTGKEIDVLVCSIGDGARLAD